MKRCYVLDTNVILHDSRAIHKFEENIVVIPLVVIEELDHFKKDKSELGANARQFARDIDNLRQLGDLRSGIDLNDIGGKIFVVPYDQTVGNCLPYQDMSIMDNRILATCEYVKTYRPLNGSSDQIEDFIFVTKDINLRIRGDIFKIKSEDYKNTKIESEELYTGHKDVIVSNELIEEVYKNKKLSLEQINNDPYPNECFTLKEEGNGKHSALVRYNSVMKEYRLISQDLKTSGILPRNTEQQFALDMLNDPDIKLISLIGKPGTGKTLISLAAGLRGVLDLQQFAKIVLLKPIVPMDNSHELGFLPGSMLEKLEPWMASYADNIEVIMSEYFKDDEPKKKTKKQIQIENEKGAGKINPVQELMALGLLEFGSMEHARGRNLPNILMILDEAQNLSKHSVKTMITRLGEGSKIILMGDISQIDSPYLDSRSNGLSLVVEAFRDQNIAGHITLKKSERSELAEIASEIL